MEDSIKEKLKEIKRSFRLMMNGVTSGSMRQKGIVYKLNWGVPVHELRAMAEPYGKDAELAKSLWAEDIRECKLMATYIMPAQTFSEEMACQWLKDSPTQEMSEFLVLNLLQYIPSAQKIALQWITLENEKFKMCGYLLLGRLFKSKGIDENFPSEEYLDRSSEAMKSTSLPILRASMNAIVSFSDIDESHHKMAEKTLKQFYLDIL